MKTINLYANQTDRKYTLGRYLYFQNSWFSFLFYQIHLETGSEPKWT